jgi:hydrogenase maturation protease
VPPVDATLLRVSVIGYGNPQRRDDGIGQYIVERLKKYLKHEKEINLRAMHQLDPDLVEELRDADLIILIDAAVNEMEDGWSWNKIEPEYGTLSAFIHVIRPAFLLGLMDFFYRRCPPTWQISVRGSDFGFGEGLTPEAETKAKKVTLEIVDFILRKIIDKNKGLEKIG